MTITEQARERMGTISAELAEAARENPGPSAGSDWLQSRKTRAEHLARLRHLYPIPGPIPDEVHEAEYFVKARDGYQIPIKIYKPVKLENPDCAVIVMLHEGGWHMGDLTDEDLNCRMFTRELGAVCINVDYRLMPEHPWPKCVDDCFDVVCWAATTASANNPILPGDALGSGLFVGGASAGANLAAVVMQMTRDVCLTPSVNGLYLCVPALLANDIVPDAWKNDLRSRHEAKDDPILDLELVKSLPNLAGEGVKDPRHSPLIHADLTSPACYLQVAGLDPLRDEALLWERLLRENGTKTRMDVYDGYGHMFWTNWPLLDRSQEFVRDTLEGMRWLLSFPAMHDKT